MASREQDAATSSWLDSVEAASLAGLPVPGQIIADKYRIEQLIGRGGMGAVYRATHVVMEKPVALKWLFPDFSAAGDTRQRFVHEARAAARIRHPNVVDVYDVGDEKGALYMVMELLEGESLEALIQRGPIAITEMLQLLTQAIRGVAAAHAKGIVHRDIKPENIFVISDPTQPSGRNAKVLDFGVSKLGEEARRNPGLTKTGVVMGTPLYMSLEQMNGARDVDARTDIYAFGVLLYRALTGHLPFQGETFASLAVAVATHTPTQPRTIRPEIPQGLNDLVVKAMARRREDRYATLEELLQELAVVRAAAGDQMTEPSRLPAGMTPVSRERLRADTVPADPVPWVSGANAAAAVSTLREQPRRDAAPRLRLWIGLVLASLALAGLAAWWLRPGPSAELRAPLPPAVPAPERAAPAVPAAPAETADWDHSDETRVIAGEEPPAAPAVPTGGQVEPTTAPAAAAPSAGLPDPGRAASSHRSREKRERGAAHEAATSTPASAPAVRTGAASATGSGSAASASPPAAVTPSPAGSTAPAPAKSDKGSSPQHRSGGVSLDEL